MRYFGMFVCVLFVGVCFASESDNPNNTAPAVKAMTDRKNEVIEALGTQNQKLGQKYEKLEKDVDGIKKSLSNRPSLQAPGAAGTGGVKKPSEWIREHLGKTCDHCGSRFPIHRTGPSPCPKVARTPPAEMAVCGECKMGYPFHTDVCATGKHFVAGLYEVATTSQPEPQAQATATANVVINNAPRTPEPSPVTLYDVERKVLVVEVRHVYSSERGWCIPQQYCTPRFYQCSTRPASHYTWSHDRREWYDPGRNNNNYGHATNYSYPSQGYGYGSGHYQGRGSGIGVYRDSNHQILGIDRGGAYIYRSRDSR